MKSKFNTQIYEVERPNLFQIFKPHNRRYCLFPKDNAVTSCLINGTIYEPYLFYFIRDNAIDLEGTDIIDIGANNGNFTLEFSDLTGDKGRVFSFEPQRIIFQQLCGNVFMNGVDNVFAYNLAIGEIDGETRISLPDYFSNDFVNFGDVSIENNKSENSEQIEVRRLDSFKFDNVRLIKIDVQGYEFSVIKGAIETINKHRPIIFIEVEDHQLRKFGYSENDLSDLIKSLGYTIDRFQKGIPYQTYSGECLDCVCIPSELLQNQSFVIR
jgi:hypothetical protein